MDEYEDSVIVEGTNVMPETVETPVKTGSPVRESPTPFDDPQRFYQPERLCPDQGKEGGWKSRP